MSARRWGEGSSRGHGRGRACSIQRQQSSRQPAIRGCGHRLCCVGHTKQRGRQGVAFLDPACRANGWTRSWAYRVRTVSAAPRRTVSRPPVSFSCWRLCLRPVTLGSLRRRARGISAVLRLARAGQGGRASRVDVPKDPDVGAASPDWVDFGSAFLLTLLPPAPAPAPAGPSGPRNIRAPWPRRRQALARLLPGRPWLACCRGP